MYLHLCHACQNGMHTSCEGTKSPPPGVLGGSMCTCPCRLEPMANEPEKAKSLIEMLKPRHMKEIKKCQWKPWDEDNFGIGTYDTGCSNVFVCTEGSWEENSFKFCPYCGAEIESI